MDPSPSISKQAMWRWTRVMASASSTTSFAPSAAPPTTLSCSGSPADLDVLSSPASPTRLLYIYSVHGAYIRRSSCYFLLLPSQYAIISYVRKRSIHHGSSTDDDLNHNFDILSVGPLSFDFKGYVDGLPRLFYNQNSWTKVSNIIFVDSPVGAGFSYSKTEQGYKSSDTKAVNQILIFLRKWFNEHPEFLSNPLYIAGDSYSGKIVPPVTSRIARGKQMASERPLNLKAYKKSCSAGNDRHQSVECANSLDDIDECIKDICTNHILEPLCTFASPRPYNIRLKVNPSAREMLQLQEYTTDAEHRLSEISLHCRTAGYLMSQTWANNAGVREALGIHKGTVPSWIRCNYDIPYTTDIRSTVKYHLDVTTRGYRSLVYSGDHDMIVPFIGTQAWIKSLNFAVVDKWRPWYVDRQIAGYTRSYANNLTFATVKGGGHTAPEYMPRQCFEMFERWVSGDPL